MAQPRFIDLGEAVGRIKQACEGRSKESKSRFFFMVGAGISYPTVPLAGEMVSHCKQKAESYGRGSGPPDENPMDTYSHWFDAAYGDRVQRQDYLRNLIEGKEITHANFRLAHILLDNMISNIVVTTNFDDLLEKALTLFGKPPIVCDHPRTVDRIKLDETSPQVIHLHGSYWFYDSCNLSGEVEDRAELSGKTSLTMASLLDVIFSDRSPLIVGYSGWENDVFMQALKRGIDRLHRRAYWFFYRRNEIGSLPDWLRTHANIWFVVPNEKSISAPATDQDDTRKSIVGSEYSGQEIKTKAFGIEKDEEPFLPADAVMDRIIKAFEPPSPQLTIDPLGFFARSLETLLPKNEASYSVSDIYGIKRIIERVKQARERDEAEAAAATIPPTESMLEKVREALRRADYVGAVQQGEQIHLDSLTPTDLDELGDAIASAESKLTSNLDQMLCALDLVVVIRQKQSELNPGRPEIERQLATALLGKGLTLGTLNRSTDEIAVYDELVQRYGAATDLPLQVQVAKALVDKGITLGTLNRSADEIAVYDELVQRYGAATDPALQAQVVKALFNKGVTLATLDRPVEAMTVYDELVQRYGAATDPASQGPVAKALFNKGVTLATLDRRLEALTVYDELVQRYGAATDPALQAQVAKALFNKGVTLATLDRRLEALTVYDELVQRYGAATDPALQAQVAKALVNKGVTLGKLNRSAEEIAVYDELMQRYGAAADPALQLLVAQVLLNKAFTLGTLDRSTESIAVYDELVQRYAAAADPALQAQVAKALVNKGARLGALDRSSEEIALYDEVVQRYGDAMDPAVQEVVGSALNGIGFQMLVGAKSLWQRGDKDAAREELIRARQNIDAAIKRNQDNPIRLGNQAYISFLLGQKQEARLLLQRAIEEGGEEIRDAELKDADINRIPEDDEFCEMIRSIPAVS